MQSSLFSVRTQRLLLLLCVSVPSFMINLEANIVAVSLPAIARSMHANLAEMEWVVSAYANLCQSRITSRSAGGPIRA